MRPLGGIGFPIPPHIQLSTANAGSFRRVRWLTGISEAAPEIRAGGTVSAAERVGFGLEAQSRWYSECGRMISWLTPRLELEEQIGGHSDVVRMTTVEGTLYSRVRRSSANMRSE